MHVVPHTDQIEEWLLCNFPVWIIWLRHGCFSARTIAAAGAAAPTPDVTHPHAVQAARPGPCLECLLLVQPHEHLLLRVLLLLLEVLLAAEGLLALLLLQAGRPRTPVHQREVPCMRSVVLVRLRLLRGMLRRPCPRMLLLLRWRRR